MCTEQWTQCHTRGSGSVFASIIIITITIMFPAVLPGRLCWALWFVFGPSLGPAFHLHNRTVLCLSQQRRPSSLLCCNLTANLVQVPPPVRASIPFSSKWEMGQRSEGPCSSATSNPNTLPVTEGPAKPALHPHTRSCVGTAHHVGPSPEWRLRKWGPAGVLWGFHHWVLSYRSNRFLSHLTYKN